MADPTPPPSFAAGEDAPAGTWTIIYDNQGNAFWFNSKTREREAAPEFNRVDKPSAGAKPQGTETTDSLKAMNATISGSRATVKNDDGTTDTYIKNPDGTWDWRSNDKGPASQGRVSNAFIETFAGAKPSGGVSQSGGGTPAAAPARLPGSAGQSGVMGLPYFTQAQSEAANLDTGISPADLIGKVPGYLTGAQNQTPSDIYPLLAQGIPSESGLPDTGYGFTFNPNTLTAPNPQLTGQIGGQNIGIGMNPDAILASAGLRPTLPNVPGANITNMRDALAAAAEAQARMSSPDVARIAKETGQSLPASASMINDAILRLQGVNYGQSPVSMVGNQAYEHTAGGTIPIPTTATSRSNIPGQQTYRPTHGSTGAGFEGADYAAEAWANIQAAQAAEQALKGGLQPAVTTAVAPKQALSELNPIRAASGFEGIVNGPTPFLAGEGGQPEKVTVQPLPAPPRPAPALGSPMYPGYDPSTEVAPAQPWQVGPWPPRPALPPDVNNIGDQGSARPISPGGYPNMQSFWQNLFGQWGGGQFPQWLQNVLMNGAGSPGAMPPQAAPAPAPQYPALPMPQMPGWNQPPMMGIPRGEMPVQGIAPMAQQAMAGKPRRPMVSNQQTLGDMARRLRTAA